MNIKERRKETKAYDLVTLAADLGFTPVRVSSRFISLEEHDSVMIVNSKIKITKKVGIIITSFGNEKLS